MNTKKVLLSLVLAGVIAVSATGCAVVQPGEIGVKQTFGSVKDQPLQPGMHFVMPGADWVTTFDTRLVALPEEFNNNLTKDGQAVKLTGTVSYRINPATVINTYKTVASDSKTVQEKIIIPKILDAAKEVLGRYTIQEFYTDQVKVGTEIQQAIQNKLAKEESIILVGFNFTGQALDEEVQKAIEGKQIALQKSQQKDIEIEIAKKEAQRLEILKKSISAETLMQDAVNKYDGTGIPPTLTGGNFIIQVPAKKAQ